MKYPVVLGRLSIWFSLALLTSACATDPPLPYRLRVQGSGSGAIVSVPSGINCVLSQSVASGACDAEFAHNQSVTLTNTASFDWEFAGWSGASCASLSTCQIKPGQDVSVSAAFERAGGPGTVRLDLTSLLPGAQGLIISVRGGRVTALSPTPQYQTSTSSFTDSIVRILIRGNLVAGKLADIQVADRKSPFVVGVQEASSGSAGGPPARRRASAVRRASGRRPGRASAWALARGRRPETDRASGRAGSAGPPPGWACGTARRAPWPGTLGRDGARLRPGPRARRPPPGPARAGREWFA